MTEDMISAIIAFICGVSFIVFGIHLIKSELNKRLKCKTPIKAIVDSYDIEYTTSVNDRVKGRYGHRTYKYTVDGIEYTATGNGTFEEKCMNLGKEVDIMISEDDPELVLDKKDIKQILIGAVGIIIGVVFLWVMLWMLNYV